MRVLYEFKNYIKLLRKNKLIVNGVGRLKTPSLLLSDLFQTVFHTCVYDGSTVKTSTILFSIIDTAIDKVAFFLADIIMYENLWCGEIMLQSTFTSQLLNLGNCLALNPEECKIVVHKLPQSHGKTAM